MNKAHVTIFALLVAGATVLGAVAVTRTTDLGRAARHTNDAAVAARTKQLGAYAAKLQKELKAKPPALPAVPKPKPVAAPWRRRPAPRRRPRSSTTGPRRWSPSSTPTTTVTTANPTAEAEVAEMTSHHGRLYGSRSRVVVFFLAWAVVAAHPWATASADPRLRTLAIRQAQLQREAKLVRKVVAARWARYRVELKARRAQIARVNAARRCRCRSAAAAARRPRRRLRPQPHRRPSRS